MRASQRRGDFMKLNNTPKKNSDKIRLGVKDTGPKTNTTHGVGGRRTALLLLGLGLYTPPGTQMRHKYIYIQDRRH